MALAKNINGNDRANRSLNGTPSSDQIYGNAGADVARGNGGADRINTGLGNDRAYGGAGDDQVSGGAQGDRLYGGGGEDRLDGGAGGDTLEGGPGDDSLLGEGGGDRIRGGAGHDSIDGEAGADSLNGNGGNDLIWGGAGQDLVIGSEGNDILSGGGDHDILNGAQGNDLLMGGSGSDKLSGGAGHDVIYILEDGDYRWSAGSGDDLIFLSNGFPEGSSPDLSGVSQSCGPGNDTVVVDEGEQGVGDMNAIQAHEAARKSAAGGNANDDTCEHFIALSQWQASGSRALISSILSGNPDSKRANPSALPPVSEASRAVCETGQTLKIKDINTADPYHGSFDLRAWASQSGNDPNASYKILASGGNNAVAGGPGCDELWGDFLLAKTTWEWQEEVLRKYATRDDPGGADPSFGNDRLYGGGGNDLINGNSGDDLLSGGEGQDVLNGGNGQDELEGGAGDDLLAGGGVSINYALVPAPPNTYPGPNWTAAAPDAQDRNPTLWTNNQRIQVDAQGKPVIASMLGGNKYSGGSGDDRILAFARELGERDNADTIKCGPGLDTVEANRVDRVDRDCERVHHGD